MLFQSVNMASFRLVVIINDPSSDYFDQGTLRLPSSTEFMSCDENSISGDERQHVNMFIETWLSKSFHGLRHDEVVTG